jgi:hypothetical protein
MDPVKELQRQIDEQRIAETDPVRLTVREMLMMVHTGMPGIVQSFDPATQTAVVQPAIQLLIVGEDEPVTLSVCPDVPVFFPGGGGLVLTFPIAKGDECLLEFSERAIDFWFDRAGVQQPSQVRMHDLSDGFAFVGFRSKPNALAAVSTTAAELRTLDGTVAMSVDASFAYHGGRAAAVPQLTGQTFLTALTTYLAALEVYGAALGGLPGMSGPAATFATAAASFHAAASTYLSTKAKVAP